MGPELQGTSERVVERKHPGMTARLSSAWHGRERRDGTASCQHSSSGSPLRGKKFLGLRVNESLLGPFSLHPPPPPPPLGAFSFIVLGSWGRDAPYAYVMLSANAKGRDLALVGFGRPQHGEKGICAIKGLREEEKIKRGCLCTFLIFKLPMSKPIKEQLSHRL
ncbi:uncharacterized [Tachysurus ichikawai]